VGEEGGKGEVLVEYRYCTSTCTVQYAPYPYRLVESARYCKVRCGVSCCQGMTCFYFTFSSSHSLRWMGGR